MTKIEKPAFSEALKFWLKLGFISFGGPAGQIAIMHQYLVEKKRWISNSRFLHALNYCMLLPGPEAQQLATYTGWLLHGTWGGLAAGLLFILPSMFILLGISILYTVYGNIPMVYALFQGLKPAVVAIVLLALIKIGQKSLGGLLQYSIAGLAFVGIFFFNIGFPLIILFAIVFGVIVQRFFPHTLKSKLHQEKTDDNEQDYYIHKGYSPRVIEFKPQRFLLQMLITAVLWATPIVSFYALSSDFAFWQQLSVFFTKAAFVTFGGAYAVLPYVAQVSVEELQWLTQPQMIDGLAFGETTPGPLVMVLSFVGFMAGYNHFSGSLLMGCLGLITTTYYTFLFCFFFIFAGAPLIEKTQSNQHVSKILGLVTAAVVGVILNLAIYLGLVVLFPQQVFDVQHLDYIALAWIGISVFAMHYFKINMITWIGISALFGLGRYWLTTAF